MDNVFELVIAILTFVLVLAILSGGTVWFSTEALKSLIQGLGKVLPGALNGTKLSGKGSWFGAVLLAAAYVLGFDVNLLGDFSAFEGLDPELMKLVNTALLAMGANTWHDRVFDGYEE